MFKFFDTIIELVTTLVNFVISFVKNVMIVIIQIGQGLGLTGMVIVYLPDIVAGAALAIISYAIVVNLLNKGG